MTFAGADSGNCPYDNIVNATNIVMEATGVGISMKEEPEISVDRVNAQNGRISVIGMDIVVQHEPFVASEAIAFGDVLCVDKVVLVLYGVKKADIGDSDKLCVIGIAFDRSSTTGVIDPTGVGFTAGNNVAVVVGRQNVSGVSFLQKIKTETLLTMQLEMLCIFQLVERSQKKSQ